MEQSTSTAAPDIGTRLRRRRRALGLTLRQVADSSGIAESFLSQVERGVHTGSIKTLQRLSAVLGLTVGDLFTTLQEESRVRRFADFEGFRFGEDACKVRLTPRTFDHLEMFLGEFGPHGSTGVEAYSHGDSEELLLVLEGEVDVTVDDTVHRLGPLDALPYQSSSEHKVAEAAGNRARVLWAMAPPAF